MTDLEIGIVVATCLAIGWAVGLVMGTFTERRAWTMRALPNGSGTAHHANGEFYCILTEKHFVHDFVQKANIKHLTEEARRDLLEG